MALKPLEASVRFKADRAIIDLRGDIDASAEEALNLAYAESESQNPGTILLNFSDVEYINSTGIALIVGLLAKTRQAHRSLQTCGLSDHYVEIFQITRLSDFMRIFPDEASAVADKSAAP
ncbi:MAG: STAS domain-containing protein [Anaerolineae bacterium]|nr:STAS domain-containing protein [Anaerolineae bacterium]